MLALAALFTGAARAYDYGEPEGMAGYYNNDGYYDTGCEDYLEGECDPMMCYNNGWCEQPMGCPEGSEEECMWTHNDGWKCECLDTECGSGRVPFVDWKTGTAVCIEGHEIEILSEFDPIESDQWWEKDCGQGRDEWGNLMWGGNKQYNWDTNMCEERSPCEPGYVKQWGNKGEFCMSEGESLHCTPAHTLTQTWNEQNGEETIACVPSHPRGAVKSDNQFHFNEVFEDDKEHWEQEMENTFHESATTINHEGEGTWKEEEFETEAAAYAGEADIWYDEVNINDEHYMDPTTGYALEEEEKTDTYADATVNGDATVYDMNYADADSTPMAGAGFAKKHRVKKGKKKAPGFAKKHHKTAPVKAAVPHYKTESAVPHAPVKKVAAKDTHEAAVPLTHTGFGKKRNGKKSVQRSKKGGKH